MNLQRIESTEMDAQRRSSGISRREWIGDEKDTMTKEIERRQLTWYGQVPRMTDVLKLQRIGCHNKGKEEEGRRKIGNK